MDYTTAINTLSSMMTSCNLDGETNNLHVSVKTCSEIRAIIDAIGIPATFSDEGAKVTFYESNCIDILHAIGNVKMTRLLFGDQPIVRMIKVDPAAIVPAKARGSDVGYDLTIIKLHKYLRMPNVIMYDTGIQARVPWGHYLEIVPRSSLSKTGWMLANSTGIIDPSYTGNLLVVVARIDPEAPLLELPFRGFQLVVRRQHHMEVVEVSAEEDKTVTARAEGGFGST
jgi:deoxyuridine 5'-triphosphate nucleotidohydrolase